MNEEEAKQFVEDMWMGLQNIRPRGEEAEYASPERRNETAGKIIEMHREVLHNQ